VQAEPDGVLDSDPHQRGSIECLSVLTGEFVVEVGGATDIVRAGETLRYRCDRQHVIRCVGTEPGHATMVVMLKAAVME
jgi:mannose-6-phosphate isomerase-like protein (cupin superfamily)